MPSESILIEKKKVVEELTKKLRSQAGVLVNYSGITVIEDTEMRVKMRESSVDYSVVKNTLMRLAIKNVGFEELEPILYGTTSLAISNDDPIAPARIIKEYADKLPNYFEIKGGFMDGRILSVSEVNAIASIPPLPILQAQLLGTMLAPIASLAVVLKAIAEKGGVPVDAELAIPAKEEKPAEAPVEAAEAKPEPAETVVEEAAPVETVAEEPAPVETVVEEAAPVEIVVETVVEEAAPVETVVEEPAPVEAVTETVAKPRAKKPAASEKPEQESGEAPVKAPAKSRAKKTADADATEAIPAEAPAKPPAKPRAKKVAADEAPKE